MEWYIDNMARRGVPAAKLLGALSAKGFVPAKNDIIMVRCGTGGACLRCPPPPPLPAVVT